jgi:hypothetical protein
MPATKCIECGAAHRLGPWFRTRCVYHDKDNHVDARLVDHKGLPEDCPGCLNHGTVEQKPFGKRAGDYILTCRECRTQYYWSEK